LLCGFAVANFTNDFNGNTGIDPVAGLLAFILGF